MRLSEELARILPGRRRRAPVQAPANRPMVATGVAAERRDGAADAFDAAHERLKSAIPPPDDE